MPPTLHPHLKRGLDFGPVHIEPEDTIEDLPNGPHNVQEHEAKRRRVEAIAAQYLIRGRQPVILSAGLRGPFDNGWKNPWTTTTIRPTRGSSEKSSATMGGRSQAVAKNLSKVRGTAKVGARPSRKRNGEHRTRGRVASPETARATTEALSFRDPDHSLNEVEIEIPPATAPSPTQDDASCSTEFFSANTERIIQTRSPLSNPFWLRRPESERRGGIHFSQNDNTEVSPTRSRSVRPRIAAVERAQTIPTKTPRAQSASARTPLSEGWRSSASASMVISSPANGLGALLATVPQQQPENSGPQPGVPIPIPLLNSEHGTQTIVALDYAPQNTEAVRIVQLSGIHGESITKGSQVHAELVSSSSTKKLISPMAPPSVPTHRTAQEYVANGAPRHDCVASPALASSTGFKYRKVSDSKCGNGEAQKAKARAVDFGSSPVRKTIASVLLVQEEQAEVNTEKGATPVKIVSEGHCLNVQTARNNAEHPELADNMTTELQQPEQGSEWSSHQSAMSTQAAMLLAQLEFQESTYRSLSPAETRTWSQTSDNTTRPISHVPSPVITPLSMFGTRLDNTLSNNSLIRGSSISTQDLFGAASPFAFSTIKKKPTAAPPSGLRFGLLGPHDHDSKSPTPSAERIALKAKGNTPSLWSFVNKKHSQASQDSLVDRSRRSVNDVELPQLDFHTSLDDFETNSGLHFTDRFLHNLDTA